MFGGVLPLHNSYIPVKHTIMPKPNLVDNQYDDLQFRFGKQTYDGLNLNPVEAHVPLHGYKMAQPTAWQRPVNMQEGKKYNRYRRMSHVKRRFSTMIEPVATNMRRKYFNEDVPL